MAKHITRIIVTVLILSIIGFVVWFFFIKPDDSKQANVAVLQVVDVLKEDKLTEKINVLKSRNGFGSNNSFDLTEPNQKVIINIRKFLLELTNLTNYQSFYGPYSGDIVNADFNAYTFYETYNYLTEAFYYYAPYVQFVKKPTNNEIEKIKKHKVNFLESYNTLIATTENLMLYQQSQSSGPVVNLNLKDYYLNMLDDMKTMSSNYVDLIIGLKDYVVSNSNSNFIFDTTAIYYNSLVYSVKEFDTAINFKDYDFEELSLTPSHIKFNNYISEATDYHLNYIKYKKHIQNGNNVPITIVNGYDTLNKKYDTILFGENNLFTKSKESRQGIVDGVTSETSLINEAYLPQVQLLINMLWGKFPQSI